MTFGIFVMWVLMGALAGVLACHRETANLRVSIGEK
jgi:hypothetical protein